MKYLLPVLLLVVSFFIAPPAHAQAVTTPTIFYCVGNNPQPPCVTIVPSQTVSQTPSAVPSVSSAPTGTTSVAPSQTVSSAPSTNPSPSTTPCSTSQSSVKSQSNGSVQALRHGRGHHKKHSSGGNGFLQQLFQFLLQLLQKLFQQLGINFPIPGAGGGSPCPSPSSAPSSSPSSSPSTVPSNAPSAAPSGTSTAPSTSPSTGVPTPTIFNAPVISPTTPPASGGTQKTNCSPAKGATMNNTVSSKCSFPDTTNTGPTGSLTSNPTSPSSNTGSGWTFSNGTYTVNGGGTLQNVSITNASVLITGSGATIKNCKITDGDPNDFGVWIEHTTNATIENCTISGTNATSGRLLAGIKDIYGDSSGTKILKNNIYYMSTGVQIDEGLVQGNYIHDLGFINGDHLNGTTSNGGSTLLTIQNNTVFNSVDQTDAISLFEDFGNQANRVIDNNLVAGGGYCMYGGQNAGGPAASNIKITNNHFSRMYFPQCGGQGGGIIAAWPPNGGGGVWSGNVWDDTGATVGQ